MHLLGFAIVILILVIAFLAYRKWAIPHHQRVRNIINGKMFKVDRSGSGGASYYVMFSDFDAKTVKYTQYGANKEFEIGSTMDWTVAGDSLRVGQMKLSLKSNGFMPPTVVLTNDADSTSSWSAPLVETTPAATPSKKL